MTVTAPPRPPRPSDPVGREEIEALVEALIEEARKRAQRRRRRNGAIVTLVALVGVAVFAVLGRSAQSQTASPALSARSSLAAATASSKIAFITAVPKTLLPKGVQFQSEVNVMNADGSGKQRLARIAWNFQAPVWSPDGQKLAFERRLDPTKYKGQCGSCDVEVYVMNADGSAQQNLTRNVAQDDSPAWSPDGQKIAFVSNRDGKPEGQFAPATDIHVMNADGSGQQNLTRNPAGEGHPVWSPDGRQIAFERVVGGVGNNRNIEIYVMNADGSDQRRLTSNPTFDGSPVWSPDGQRVAFASDRNQLRYHDDVYVMNADGSGPRRLTRNLAQESWPVWSPDGQRIAFTRVRNTPQRRDRNSDVYVMNADGSGQRNLTRNPAGDGHPTWSPNGRTIGFVSNRGGNRDIYVVNADGSGLRNLTRNVRRQAFGIAWSPAQKK
jgi:Tol biopolymer transport system component